jgi:serine/threonine protein kinase
MVVSQMTGQCGTFQWMAPEVINNGRYSEKADIFSFAVILWELVAREVPYRDMNTVQVSVAVLTKGMRPTMPRVSPPEYATLINDCWHQDPEKRPTFDYIVDRLQAFLNNLSAFTASIPTATSTATTTTTTTTVTLVAPPGPDPPAYTEEVKQR